MRNASKIPYDYDVVPEFPKAPVAKGKSRRYSPYLETLKVMAFSLLIGVVFTLVVYFLAEFLIR